jgi:hypothetical protein
MNVKREYPDGIKRKEKQNDGWLSTAEEEYLAYCCCLSGIFHPFLGMFMQNVTRFWVKRPDVLRKFVQKLLSLCSAFEFFRRKVFPFSQECPPITAANL